MNSALLFKPALVALSALCVSACVSLLPETTPSAVYRLSSPAPRAWTGENWTVVRIIPPVAPRGLGGDEIAIETADGRIAYAADVRWIASSSRIVQTLIADVINASNSRLAPSFPEDGVRADYELRLDLREFEAAYDQGDANAPLIRVRVTARLIATDGRRFVGSHVFASQIRASSNRIGAIVAAFDQAATGVSQEIADWTASQTAPMTP